jgi:glycosyltransferase involved in cell wall biosynthesis
MSNDGYIHVKVSVITVVRNAVDKIESTIKSVLSQNYDNIEYIVIDGASTDGTIEIIERYRDRIAVVVSESDNGIYDALNKGILQSSGDWISVMNAGDVYATDNVLADVFSKGYDFGSVGVIYGDAIAVDKSAQIYYPAGDDVSRLDKGPCYRHGASFVDRKLHLNHLFDLTKKDKLGFALDYEQIYRMYESGVSFLKVPVTVIKYEMRGASTTSPFKATYYNYLITHKMTCSIPMKWYLFALTLWRGFFAVMGRSFIRRKDDSLG